MHRALKEFGPHERSMRRVTIQGDVPFFKGANEVENDETADEVENALRSSSSKL